MTEMETHSTAQLAGRLLGKWHVLPIRIYYEDTDFSGFVYHANYIKFCERGRSDFLRLLGVHHHELHWSSSGNSMGFVVTEMTCKFHKPAAIDDIVKVNTCLKASTGVRFVLEQKIWRGPDLLFSAIVTAALVDNLAKPLRLPREIREKLSNYICDGKARPVEEV